MGDAQGARQPREEPPRIEAAARRVDCPPARPAGRLPVPAAGSSARDRRPAARALRLLGLALLLAFLPLAPLSAFGPREDPLANINKAIEEQRYSEAILYLTDFIKRYPDRFDEAQAKLRRIIEIREEYNRKGRELTELLVDPEVSEEDKLAKIRELETIERKPNKATLDFIANAKATALFVANRRSFDDIMARGRAAIDGGEYARAAAVYEEGYALYRQEFDEGPYDELTKAAVAETVVGLRRGVASYAEAQAALEAAWPPLRAALAARDPAAATEALPAFEAAFADHALRRNEVARGGRSLERQFELILLRDPTATDSSFLPFAYRFTLGRVGSEKPEGVLGSMDSQFAALMGPLESEFAAGLEELRSAAEKAWEEGDWAGAARLNRSLAAWIEPGLAVLGYYGLLAPAELYPVATAYGKSILDAKGREWLRLAHLRDLALAGARLAELEARVELAEAEGRTYAEALPAAPALPPLAPTLAALDGFRLRFREAAAGVAAEQTAARAAADRLARYAAAGLGDERSAAAQGAFDARAAGLLAASRQFEVVVAARAAAVEFADIKAEHDRRGAALAQGKSLLDGVASADAALGGALLRFPIRSAEILTAEEESLRRFRARAAEFLAKLQRDLPYVASSPSVSAWAEETRALDRTAAAWQAERTTVLARAVEQRRQADSAKLEAERRTTEARTALGREDFETARDRLNRARDRYLASLSLSEDPQLRADSDRLLQRLGEDIVKAENDRVVRETRALINEGRSLYFQGQFDRAEESLLRARARWATTHGNDPEPEVEYWLRLAQAALSIKTGRDIPVNAPLYAEMSQLLSLARGYFDEGKKLLDQRKKTDALAMFSLSRQKLNEVRVLFPLNQDAGVLSLRIDQLIDPEAFRRDFGQKFSEARAKLDINPREAFSDLQNLSAIDPRYPGLKAAIERGEILLGIRIPPPDPAKLRRARDLVAAARRVVDAGDTTRFPFALEQLNEAILLDPTSEAAVALKDRILTNQGGTAQLVLSGAAESQYQQAVLLFQNGEYLQAYGIVERLMQDSRNAKSTKLQDLRKRIQDRL